MDSGAAAAPVPVAAPVAVGEETLSDSRAEMVHASMSIVPEAERKCCGTFCRFALACDGCCCCGGGGGASSGGGTAL